MKEKIFNTLKQEYAHLGLGDNILSGLADMLSGVGVVTDENLKSIVTGQKSYLEGLQRSNDKRVQDAIAKTSKEASEKADAMRKEHEATISEKQREIDALKGLKSEHTMTDGLPDWYKAEKAEREKRDREWMEQMDAIRKEKSESDAKIKAMEEEKARMDAERAAQVRRDSISARAKEKGIPDWMIKHGFADIPSDADEAKIDEILSGYAQEISTQLLPEKNHLSAFEGKEATKSDTDKMVAKLFPATAKV